VWNTYPKYVISQTLQDPEWNNSHVLPGDAVTEVSKLKGEPGKDIMVYGSARLVDTLLQQGLIDDCRIWMFPVILGSGKRLFPDGNEKRNLELVDTHRFDSGVVVLCYQPQS
jgi:dihydrofolate reductase